MLDPRHEILVAEATDQLDNAIRLLDQMGKKELSLQLHNVAVELDLYLRTDITAQQMTKYEDLDGVIDMFAYKTAKVSA
jgi:hypothetical protein